MKYRKSLAAIVLGYLALTGALWLGSTPAFAQCNGVFPNNTVCGNITGANNTPRPTNPSSFLGAAGGTNGQQQYNNGGALGGFTGSGDLTTNTATGVNTLANTAVTPGTYGDGTHVSQVTIDAKGRVTSASNVVIPNTSPIFSGAKCNVISVVSASVSIASASPNLTVTGATFVLGDVGKIISVPNAGVTAGGIVSTLNATISAFVDATHVTLNANAGTTVSAAAETVIYGTDDTTAFQTAISSSNQTMDLTAVAGCMLTGTLTTSAPKTINGVPGVSKLWYRQLTGTTVVQFILMGAQLRLVNFSIDSDSGSTITSATSAALINVNGKSVYIDNMDLNGNKATQLQPAMVGVDGVGNNSAILNSHIFGFPSYVIHGTLRASHVEIRGNRIDHGPKVGSAAGVVVFNSAGAVGAVMGDLRFTNNWVDMSDLAVADMNTAFFVWGGDATTFAYDQVVISNNNALGTQGATGSNSGGAIIFNTNHATINGNNFKYIGECIGINGTRVAAIGNTLIGCGTYSVEAGGNDITIADNVCDAENVSPFGFSVANCIGCTISNNVMDGQSAPAAYIAMQVYVASSGTSQAVSILGNSIFLPAAGTGKGIYLFVTAGATKYSDYSVVGNTIVGGGASSEGISAGGTAGTQAGFLIGPNRTGQGTGIDVGASFTGFCYVTGSNSSTTKTTGAGFPGACL